MNRIDYTLSILITLPILATLVLGFFLMRQGKHVMGKPTINPLLFYTGKFMLFTIWGIFWLITIFPEYRDIIPFLIQKNTPEIQKIIASLLLIPANLYIISAYYTMGKITYLGLPTEKHKLRTTGIYRICRNPMYTSFFFLNAATLLYLPSILLLVIMIYGMIVHHFIILSEEKYLEKEFGDRYLDYKMKVPRCF